MTPWSENLSVNHPCPHCGETGTLRPAAVRFDEVPLDMDAIDDAAKELGISMSEINLEPSDNARLFDKTSYEPATQTVPTWVERVLAPQGNT